MQKLRSAAIGLVTSLAASMASAALSVADLSAPGDGLLTVDAETGLGWLDITLARGMSLHDMSSQIRFAPGVRLATSAELDELIAHGGANLDHLDWLGAWAASPELSASVGGPTTLLSGVVGGDGPREDGQVRVETVIVTRNTVIGGSGGVITDYPMDPQAGGAYADVWSQAIAALQLSAQQTQLTAPLMGPDLGTFVRRQTTWTSPLATSPDVGVFLVKEVSVVPEPSTLALMGLGLVGVFSLVRRRNAAVV